MWREQTSVLKEVGVEPNTYVMDNETLKDLKNTLRNYDTKYQRVPPHNHITKLSEQAIQIFNAHFKEGLASLDPDFPISERDRIVEQYELTLNLLCSSISNLQLSAYAYLFGHFDYSATPLIPPGTKALSHHTKPLVRILLGLNGEEGRTIGP